MLLASKLQQFLLWMSTKVAADKVEGRSKVGHFLVLYGRPNKTVITKAKNTNDSASPFG